MKKEGPFPRILFRGCQGGGECRQQRQHQYTENRQVPDRQRRQLASTDSFCVFLFLGEGCGDPLLLLPASHPVCWRGLAEPTPEERGRTAGGRRQHTEGSLQRRTTDRPPSSPEQRTRESLAERRLRTLWRPVEPAEVPASPHQSQRATASGAVRASLADAVRLGGSVSVAVPHGVPGVLPPTARALGLVARSGRLLLGSIYKV